MSQKNFTPLGWCQQHSDRIAFFDLGVSYLDLAQAIRAQMKTISPEDFKVLESPSNFVPQEIYEWCVIFLAHLESGHVVALKTPNDPYTFSPLELKGPGLLLKTSGSAQAPKLVFHPWKNAIDAAYRFQSFFENQAEIIWQLNLPLHHIGGLSLFLRSLIFGSGLVVSSDRKTIHPMAQAISLVPTQLQRLLREIPERLKELDLILIGGAPASTKLKAECAALSVSYSYGLTESFAAVGASRIGQSDRAYFFKGIEAHISAQGILELKGCGMLDSLITNDGQIVDHRDSYYPTNDMAKINTDRSFEILGRADQVIISGGEKIHLYEIETLLNHMEGVEFVKAIGIPHKDWGEALGLFIAPNTVPMQQKIQQKLEMALGKHSKAKYFFEYPLTTGPGIKLSKEHFLELALKDISKREDE